MSYSDLKRKYDQRFCIAGTVIILLVFLANYVFNTQLHDSVKAASVVWNVIGVVFYVASIYWLWSSPNRVGGLSIHPGVLTFILLAAGLMTSCGFNFIG